MSEPILYQLYDRHQAVAPFGDDSAALSLCDGQWLIFPDVVACLTRVGTPPKLSHFVNGSGFFWVADKTYKVRDDRYISFLPPQVVGADGRSRSIHLFVRSTDSEAFLYVGELHPSYMQQGPGKESHGMARFELKTTLPSAIWNRLGGLQIDEKDHVSVDRALDRLRGRTTVEDRLQVLKTLVEYWHGAIGPEDGIPESELKGVRLPMPLRWWFRWAGRRTNILSGQNTFLGPDKLKTKDGRLLFYGENQWVYEWGTMHEGDDPPVFGRYPTCNGDEPPWETEAITLSEHLILTCMFEAIGGSPYGAAAACLDRVTLSRIEEIIRPIAIKPWRWPDSTQFYASDGAFMFACKNGPEWYSVWIGAKTEQPLQFLKPLLDDAWEYTAI